MCQFGLHSACHFVALIAIAFVPSIEFYCHSSALLLFISEIQTHYCSKHSYVVLSTYRENMQCFHAPIIVVYKMVMS